MFYDKLYDKLTAIPGTYQERSVKEKAWVDIKLYFSSECDTMLE